MLVPSLPCLDAVRQEANYFDNKSVSKSPCCPNVPKSHLPADTNEVTSVSPPQLPSQRPPTSLGCGVWGGARDALAWVNTLIPFCLDLYLVYILLSSPFFTYYMVNFCNMIFYGCMVFHHMANLFNQFCIVHLIPIINNSVVNVFAHTPLDISFINVLK